MTTLSNGGVYSACAVSVYVSGNDVYAAGLDYNGSTNEAKLWKNGQIIFSTLGQEDAAATSVFVVN
jgi:hypothetical protein